MSLSSDARPLVYHSNHQALSTARFCRAGQLATADTCRLYRYIACVVCLLARSECCAKTAEPIKMPFEFAQETVHVFGGARITHGTGISGRRQYLGMPITISWPRSMFSTLFARGSSDAATAGQSNLSLLSVSVISPHRRSQCQMRAIPTHVLTFRGLCFCVLVIAITDEPIEMPLGGGADSRRPKKLRMPIRLVFTVAPPGEYVGSICAASGMRAVATVTVVSCCYY